MIANMPTSGSPEKRRDCIGTNRFSLSYFDADTRVGQYRVNTRRLPCSDGQTIEKLRAFSAERMLIEIVVRIAHVRVFGFVTDFRRKFCVTGMDVRNVRRQQGLIAVVPNWKRKGQDLNKTGHLARRCASRSLPNAIAGSGGVTFSLIDLVNGHEELSRRDDEVRDTATEFAGRTKIVARRILNIGESSDGKANECS